MEERNKFIQDCLIRNADKNLWVKVLSLGYYPEYMNMENNLGGSNLVCEHGRWHYTDSDNKPNCIDCKECEDLFLSIASLRSDTDKGQWFTDGLHWEKYPLDGLIIDEMKVRWKNYYGSHTDPHKATVDELIKKFNK